MQVSVVITTYNSERFIERAVRSLLSQSLRPQEIVIADDCSTDRTLQIVDKLQEYHNELTVVPSKVNGGVSRNRNNGIFSVKNDLFCTMDVDDYFHKHKLKNEIQQLKESDNIIAYSNIIKWNPHNFMKSRYVELPRYGCDDSSKVLDKFLSRQNQLPRDFIMSKRLFEKVGGYDEALTLYEDWDFKCKLAQLDVAWAHTKLPGTFYVDNPNSLSAVGSEKLFDAQQVVMQRYSKIVNMKREDEASRNLNFVKQAKRLISLCLKPNLITEGMNYIK